MTVRSLVALAAIAAMVATSAHAQKKYDPGVSDSEIKLGHTNPYSGPLSAYGVIGKGITAFWQMVNDQGGINGRKVNFITYDDGFQPSSPTLRIACAAPFGAAHVMKISAPESRSATICESSVGSETS